jgi:ubiquinol-cytochrome c reductase cytochrome b subunit
VFREKRYPLSHYFLFYLSHLILPSFVVCIFSGIFLTIHYKPFGNVFRCVEEITTVIPYGFFFRRLHYITGELLLILILIHIGNYFFKRTYKRYRFKEWLKLIVSVYILFAIVFMGFILKGDKEGIFAGNIMLNIIKKIPFIGDSISNIFIRSEEEFFWLPYLHHCFFLTLLFLFLIRKHIHSWLTDMRFFIYAILFLFVCAIFFKMPMDIPPNATISIVKGPWFFWGIQECLRKIPPLLAAIGLPFFFFFLVTLLPLTKGYWEYSIRYSILIFIIAYSTITIWGLVSY